MDKYDVRDLVKERDRIYSENLNRRTEEAETEILELNYEIMGRLDAKFAQETKSGETA